MPDEVLDIDAATRRLVEAALAEDVGTGDVTSLATVPAGASARAKIVAKADGVVAGLDTAEAVFRTVDAAARWTSPLRDGCSVKRGDVIAEVTGPARSLLMAERTALNFLGRLSGVATLTARYVAAVAATNARIIDTRKTTPGWRLLEKAAVRAGGGSNHRVGLFDMVLIKENHIRAAGGISAAATACRAYLNAVSRSDVPIEIETTDRDEVDAAVRAECDRIMLDNMSLAATRDAVARIRAQAPQCEIEASGNMTLDRVRAVADIGVDFISVGALTHSAPALDVSMLFDYRK